jgi:NAD(P)H-dependent FMN reductase
MDTKKRILGICGSLRKSSSSAQVLLNESHYVPDDVEFVLYEGIALLPHFDDNTVIPEPVAHFYDALSQADGVLICTPEYAFGVPGSLKNALEWPVGAGSLVNKPVALITAASSGEKGHAALLQILTALSANINAERSLLISFIRSKINSEGAITDPATEQSIKSVMEHLMTVIYE